MTDRRRARREQAGDPRQTERTRRSYDRLAPLYDKMDALAERRYRAWRERLWSLVRGPRVLEVGVGTGKNLPHHPSGVAITAIDLSPKMLERARRRARTLGAELDLREGDVQALEFADDSFDEVVGTFVFCSVPDPVLGLGEVRRVLSPGGRLLLVEHVRAANVLAGRLQDLANPLSVRMTGVNINRRTASNVERAGFTLERDEALGMRGVFRLMVARKA
jgi:ubiquinone/menaquinone biosynthesis C-methylase UbiE